MISIVWWGWQISTDLPYAKLWKMPQSYFETATHNTVTGLKWKATSVARNSKWGSLFWPKLHHEWQIFKWGFWSQWWCVPWVTNIEVRSLFWSQWWWCRSSSMNGAAHAGEEFCFSCKLIQTARNDRIKYEKCWFVLFKPTKLPQTGTTSHALTSYPICLTAAKYKKYTLKSNNNKTKLVNIEIQNWRIHPVNNTQNCIYHYSII